MCHQGVSFGIYEEMKMKIYEVICILCTWTYKFTLAGVCSVREFKTDNAFLFCWNNESCTLLCHCGYTFSNGVMQTNYTCLNDTGSWEPTISICEHTSGFAKIHLYCIVASAVGLLIFISSIIIMEPFRKKRTGDLTQLNLYQPSLPHSEAQHMQMTLDAHLYDVMEHNSPYT